MRLTIRFILVATLLVASASGLPASAGPYFNVTGGDVENQSKAAVADLSNARIALIRMLTALDAGNVGLAEDQRKTAMGLLIRARDQFGTIESKVPNQPIKLEGGTPQERQIFGD